MSRYPGSCALLQMGVVRGSTDIVPHLDLAFCGNIRSKPVATNSVLEKAIRAREPAAAED